MVVERLIRLAEITVVVLGVKKALNTKKTKGENQIIYFDFKKTSKKSPNLQVREMNCVDELVTTKIMLVFYILYGGDIMSSWNSGSHNKYLLQYHGEK